MEINDFNKNFDNICNFMCDKCNGYGILKIANTIEFELTNIRFKQQGPITEEYCNKCLGTGNLDWIEYAIGEKNKENGFFSFLRNL